MGQFSRILREPSKLLASFPFSNLRKFRGLPSSILKPSRCPRSRKFSKFENENENFRGLRSRLATLVGSKKVKSLTNMQYFNVPLFLAMGNAKILLLFYYIYLWVYFKATLILDEESLNPISKRGHFSTTPMKLV